MNTTHKDVLACVDSWMIGNIVECKDLGRKTAITYKGKTVSYPHWLALRKINVIGANHGIEEVDL